MSNVIFLKKETKISKMKPSISLADMIFNKNKRNEIYNFYDSIYTSSKEEDEIFQAMRNRYWKGDE